jgi:hypothetical protein
MGLGSVGGGIHSLGENPRDFLTPVLLQTRVDTPAILQTWPFQSILALWGHAPCTLLLQGLCPPGFISHTVTPLPRALKSIALSLLGLDTIGLQLSWIKPPRSLASWGLGQVQWLQSMGKPLGFSPKAP